MLIRRFRDGDEGPVSRMIAKTLRISNSPDYPEAEIARLTAYMSPDYIREAASRRHFFVAAEDGAVIGCASIGPLEGRADESGIFTVFVDPDRQKLGIERSLISAAEADEYFLCANRVEIAASVTAVGFYMKLGYAPKNGVLTPDDENLIHLEKHRKV